MWIRNHTKISTYTFNLLQHLTVSVKSDSHFFSFTLNTTNSMEQRKSWKARSCSAPQGIPRILCNPNIHHDFTKGSYLVPSLNQTNSVHTLQYCIVKIYFYIYLLFLPIFQNIYFVFGVSRPKLWKELLSNNCYTPRPSHSPHVTNDHASSVALFSSLMLLRPKVQIFLSTSFLKPTRLHKLAKLYFY
jgi:hypothetical protein